jgi:hypothetical protein
VECDPKSISFVRNIDIDKLPTRLLRIDKSNLKDPPVRVRIVYAEEVAKGIHGLDSRKGYITLSHRWPATAKMSFKLLNANKEN